MKKRHLTAIAVVALLVAGLWIIALISNKRRPDPPSSRPTPTPVPALPKERVENGERLYKKMRPAARPTLSGFAAPSVRLVVPKREWGRLTRSEQVDITFYAESLIPRVRDSPENFVDIPTNAPVYKSAVSYARNICGDCWEIIIGERTSKSGVLTVDSKVVQGDSVWEADDSSDRGQKGSSFRAGG